LRSCWPGEVCLTHTGGDGYRDDDDTGLIGSPQLKLQAVRNTPPSACQCARSQIIGINAFYVAIGPLATTPSRAPSRAVPWNELRSTSSPRRERRTTLSRKALASSSPNPNEAARTRTDIRDSMQSLPKQVDVQNAWVVRSLGRVDLSSRECPCHLNHENTIPALRQPSGPDTALFRFGQHWRMANVLPLTWLVCPQRAPDHSIVILQIYRYDQTK
jgi:hypothetical protein